MALTRLARAAIAVITGAGWPAHAMVHPAVIPPVSGPPSVTAAAPAHRLQPDVLIVAPKPLPAGDVIAVEGMRGVRAAETVDAASVLVNGKYVQMLGVNPATFRPFAARPTAAAASLWRHVASGQIAVSYTMGKQDKLPAGARVTVSGRQPLRLRVGGLGTVGIAGVDAVISRSVAAALGFPAGNAMVVNAPHTSLTALKARLSKLLPKTAQVEILAVPGRQPDSTAGAAGAIAARSSQPANGTALSYAQTVTMLRAALSRVGMPYVWGGAGPRVFDCSGLVQWSFAQAGIAMPRVAADQARTGPAVPISQLRPGDVLFYRTDPTAPGYISHVAIYLGHGEMVQAPEPGMKVDIVPADFGPEYAGAVQVAPSIAAQVAGVAVG